MDRARNPDRHRVGQLLNRELREVVVRPGRADQRIEGSALLRRFEPAFTRKTERNPTT